MKLLRMNNCFFIFGVGRTIFQGSFSLIHKLKREKTMKVDGGFPGNGREMTSCRNFNFIGLLGSSWDVGLNNGKDCLINGKGMRQC